MSVYLDASAILPMLVEEPASDGVEAFIRDLDEPILVGEFAAAEVASALSRLTRMGALTVAQADERLTVFDAWRAEATADPGVDGSDLKLASRFVRRFALALRAPDALHLAVCLREGLRLVTLDARLAAAARTLGLETAVNLLPLRGRGTA